ncbi:MAG TPA: hypothetical protein VMR54_15935 [Thermoanaerobaculia bacterium]|nr:hypothetical protein [Thermoanaerobaculia bacterium]
MKNSRLLLGLLVWGLWHSSPVALAETWRMDFDSDAAGRPPAFLDFETLLVPGPANWMVVADRNPPSAPNQVTQILRNRPPGSIAVALRRNVALRDGKLSVGLKKLTASAGLVLRMAGPKDFLLLLLDCSSGEARLTSYRHGVPTELARGKAAIDLDWGILRVDLSGPTVSASWNEKELLQGLDPKPATGRVGLATEGPGFASFDELVVVTP